MSKTVTVILVVLVVLIGGFAALAAMQPNDFRVTRKATIHADTGRVFEQVNDLRKMNEWSPWSKLDPNAVMTYEGPAAGIGAIVRWSGNDKVGAGAMTITESLNNERVGLRLDFLKPFASTSQTEFILQPDGGNTVLTWTMAGKNNFISKAMSLVMDCDKMIGEQFEKGLASLDALMLGQTAVPSAGVGTAP